MASQTPVESAPAPTTLTDNAYLQGWAAMTRMMVQGLSWSGRERNNCFLNMGDGTFADVSAVSGLDFLDDGRALAVTDWDGDGDLDLWLKNRTGPQLRFMRNDQPAGQHTLALRLAGKECNRDAIGARVEVVTGGGRFVRAVSAGDGYLAQSSRTLHFGLGDNAEVQRIVIHWPGGQRQAFTGLQADHHYRIEQGGAPTLVRRPAVKPVPTAVQPTKPTDRARVVLRVPLPLPPSMTVQLFGPLKGRSKLLNLWAQWCAPCIGELTDFAAHYTQLHEAGLDILALSVDAPGDRDQAARSFAEHIAGKMTAPAFGQMPVPDGLADTLEAVYRHVVDKPGQMSVPTSFLIDPAGALQVLYIGPVSTTQLLADLQQFVRTPTPPHRRGAYPGRWYFRIPRNLPALAADLEQRERGADARFYRGVGTRPRTRPPG